MLLDVQASLLFPSSLPGGNKSHFFPGLPSDGRRVTCAADPPAAFVGNVRLHDGDPLVSAGEAHCFGILTVVLSLAQLDRDELERLLVILFTAVVFVISGGGECDLRPMCCPAIPGTKDLLGRLLDAEALQGAEDGGLGRV